MPHGRTRKQTNGIAVWIPAKASSVATSTLLRHDGDGAGSCPNNPRDMRTEGRSSAGPDVKGLRNHLDRGGAREEYQVEKVVYLRDKQGEQRRWEEITKRSSSHEL